MSGDMEADTFYILYEGHAKAILDKEFKPSVEVKQYAKGSYFGELALIRNAPRASNIVADGDCTVVSIDRSAFVRLLGSKDKTRELIRQGSTEYTTTGQVVTPGGRASELPGVVAVSNTEEAETEEKPAKCSCCIS